MHLSSPAHPQKLGYDKPYGRSLSCSWVRRWWTASPHCSWSHPGRFPQGFGALLTAHLPSTHAELWKDVPWSEKQQETWQTLQGQSKSSQWAQWRNCWGKVFDLPCDSQCRLGESDNLCWPESLWYFLNGRRAEVKFSVCSQRKGSAYVQKRLLYYTDVILFVTQGLLTEDFCPQTWFSYNKFGNIVGQTVACPEQERAVLIKAMPF